MALRSVGVFEGLEGGVGGAEDFVERDAVLELGAAAGEEVEEERVEGAGWRAVLWETQGERWGCEGWRRGGVGWC